MRRSILVSILILPGLVLAGCEETTTAPPPGVECDETAPPLEMADVAGRYEATTFIGHTESGEDEDVLDLGGSLTLILTADGSTAGTLFIPGPGLAPDFSRNLVGTWTLECTTVTFQQEANTFIRDVPFDYQDGLLVSNSQFADVVLTRQ